MTSIESQTNIKECSFLQKTNRDQLGLVCSFLKVDEVLSVSETCSSYNKVKADLFSFCEDVKMFYFTFLDDIRIALENNVKVGVFTRHLYDYNHELEILHNREACRLEKFLKEKEIIGKIHTVVFPHCDIIGISCDVSIFKNAHSLNLCGCVNIRDVSSLKGVNTLILECCDKIKDVSHLGQVHTLNIANCNLIEDVSALGNVYNLDICAK